MYLWPKFIGAIPMVKTYPEPQFLSCSKNPAEFPLRGSWGSPLAEMRFGHSRPIIPVKLQPRSEAGTSLDFSSVVNYYYFKIIINYYFKNNQTLKLYCTRIYIALQLQRWERKVTDLSKLLLKNKIK